ncbi:adenosylmethionine--8-amino-7-oxononanoate transaminase [Pedococcus sp.]|uniref:adenosylmethionine--8-amino-7-oxononanoate transaminase n=1 Tax=Pedococcus sp. TaxID=2860345 RepID=UPI002E147D5F|nr:adenosylmethionine--8-amino-7-oxononanoate transaminase [Pedococcus sp.]
MGDLGRLFALDQAHVWHPYSSASDPGVPCLAESAAGVRLALRLRDGSAVEAIDAMSSWWCAIHGYAVPELDAAAQRQLGRMSHVMFGGLTHEPAVALAERLVGLTPEALQRVFFADSGSVAVEVAMKMALQLHVGRGARRTRFFTIRGGYHGDTFSPMSVTDPVGGMHSLFTGILPEHLFAPAPPAGVDVADDDPAMVEWERATRRLYAAHADEVAAVIVEPVLQGAGGMRFYSPYAVRVLASLAREHGALVIFDEIATGFGRTGTLFAMEQVGVVPDIMCLGKALTGGYLTLSAVLCTREVAEGVSSERAGGALMHGPTFMANPLACSIALASLDLLQANDFRSQVAALQAGLTRGLAPATGLSSVREVRVLGGVGVIQLREPVRVAQVTASALQRGVWVRPFRDLVYTMPPFVTGPDDVSAIGEALVGAVRDVHG